MPLKHIALATMVAAIWGINFVVIRIGLDNFPPILFSAIRFSLAAVPLVFFIGPPPVAWRWVIAIGFTLGIVKFSLLFIGIDLGTPPGLASLVLQCQAFFTALFAAMILRERPALVQILGIIVAFAGIGLIATLQGSADSLLALALIVAAGAVWGVANILTKMSGALDMFRLIVWVSVVPPLPLFALSYAFEGSERIEAAVTQLSWTGVGAVVYIAFISTIVAFGVWGFLLRVHSASIVAPFSLLVPIFGMASSALILGETFGPTKLMASALVFVGLLLVVFGPALRARLRAAPL